MAENTQAANLGFEAKLFLTAVYSPPIKFMDFCLICISYGHYDKLGTLPHKHSSISPIGTDIDTQQVDNNNHSHNDPNG